MKKITLLIFFFVANNLFSQIVSIPDLNFKAILLAANAETNYNIAKDLVLKMTFKGEELRAGDKLPKTSAIDFVLGNGNRPGEETSDEEPMAEEPIVEELN